MKKVDIVGIDTNSLPKLSNAETLDRINDKFLWTGNSEANLPEGEENVRTIRMAEAIREGGISLYGRNQNR